jgi:anhydro-N-acetylmuramic acid kinase
MPLRDLISRRNLTILGMNSGTSADGLDLAVVRFTRNRDGLRSRFIAGRTVRYPKALRAVILKGMSAEQQAVAELVYLDSAIGQFFGRTAAEYLKELRARGIRVDALASHGQTIRHLPQIVGYAGFRAHGTLQLGSLDCIAAATGKVVVGDFRQADVALGNEGAPITVAAMALLFGSAAESRLILNLGGMANFFHIPRGCRTGDIQAADIGPGNVLCDLLAEQLFGRRYDAGGRLAMRGKVSPRLLSVLRHHRFFTGRQMSTGREDFGQPMVERMRSVGAKLRLDHHDVMATAAELTVSAVGARLRPLVEQDRYVTKLYLTGGGVYNRYFREGLARQLPGLTIASVEELGIDPDLVEASAYAAMACACLGSEPLPTVFVTGRRQKLQPVLGKIVQPPTKKA